MKSAFVGYPSQPTTLVDGIIAGIATCREWGLSTQLVPWSELDGESSPIILDILKTIRETEASVFDVSVLNENIFYEIGYAVGAEKELHVLINPSIRGAMKRHVDLGILDTQRLKHWKNGSDFAQLLRAASDPYKKATRTFAINRQQPLFFQHHAEKIEFATAYFSRVKGQRLGVRRHDPEEDHRLPLDAAYREIASSAGAFLSLLPHNIEGSEDHNLRAFLLAGIADGCGVPRVLLKYGDFVPSFDLRDGVKSIKRVEDIDDFVTGLIPKIHERMQELELPSRPTSKSHLVALQLGASSAENEVQTLDGYFVETREYRRTLRGEARLVVGRKGTGKTAIFWQVRNRARADRSNIVLDLSPKWSRT